jgi:CO/xanthine dehydrogenase FAD-binding subunit
MSVEALCARLKGRALQSGEFIVDVRLPATPARSGGACVGAGRAGASDGSVGVAVLLVMQDDLETCCGARLAVRCDGAQPARVPDAERFLQGRHLDEFSVEEAGGLVAETAWLPNPASSLTDVSPVLKVAACQAIRLALDRSRPRAAVKRRVGPRDPSHGREKSAPSA